MGSRKRYFIPCFSPKQQELSQGETRRLEVHPGPPHSAGAQVPGLSQAQEQGAGWKVEWLVGFQTGAHWDAGVAGNGFIFHFTTLTLRKCVWMLCIVSSP